MNDRTTPKVSNAKRISGRLYIVTPLNRISNISIANTGVLIYTQSK
ncbi:MAG: hypothetical protein ACI9JR_001627, partial [Gammaproteobacteria bacterium]